MPLIAVRPSDGSHIPAVDLSRVYDDSTLNSVSHDLCRCGDYRYIHSTVGNSNAVNTAHNAASLPNTGSSTDNDAVDAPTTKLSEAEQD